MCLHSLVCTDERAGSWEPRAGCRAGVTERRARGVGATGRDLTEPGPAAPRPSGLRCPDGRLREAETTGEPECPLCPFPCLSARSLPVTVLRAEAEPPTGPQELALLPLARTVRQPRVSPCVTASQQCAPATRMFSCTAVTQCEAPPKLELPSGG